ncbi:acid phosphatase class B [Glycomyces algeriensis]|uniref:Polynucleotide kinase PNKP phosphatase domain-containing protein n=1 Tax=Glycomyces algeriensis TaxID=256037 RepID=A0A9W6G6Q9_9ACTN|nr:hypothetical protein [Glycomyces algeriensis]MDR7348823.1 acid phosphatase class B [Glycomyces algeriensis]GLI41526.1 hypothetical protein GALLR39Z86_13760 [Glycomyces algeriensis]
MTLTKHLPNAAIVDIDGTVALMGSRDPYDETTVIHDAPNYPIVRLVTVVAMAGHSLVFVSGRTEACREDTETWLARRFPFPHSGLHMRAIGDKRRDAEVKTEIYRTHIEGRYNVRWVFDDRNQTVAAWRALGLTCLQVAPGDF